MTTPLLVFALGPEAALIAARAKAMWEVFNAQAAVLAIDSGNVPGLDPDRDIAPLERDEQDLPRAPIATALSGFDEPPDVLILADLSEHAAAFCGKLAAEARRSIGAERHIWAILILPEGDRPPLEQSASGDILGTLWPIPGQSALLDRLYLVENSTEGGFRVERETVREAVALRIAIEGDAGAAGKAIRARSDALPGSVRSLGGVTLRYPGRAVAELAGARLAAALVEGWCGAAADPGGPLPDALPVHDDALDNAGLTPESTAELEAFLDELLWSLRARYPKLAAVAGVLPAELALLEEVHFGVEGGTPDNDLPVLVRHAGDDKPRSVLEPARDRLGQQVVRWRSRIEWELVDRCRPAFLEGGGLARGLTFLESLHVAFEHTYKTVEDRQRLAEQRQQGARIRLDGALADLGAASRRPFFRNMVSAARLADCRRAAYLYLTTRAERVLLGDFENAMTDVLKTVADLRDRLSRLTAVLTSVQHGLDDRARAIADAWHADNLLDPGDPETAYRDAVGALPDEEALLGSVHEDFVAGGSVLDLPIGSGDEQHLIERLHERALLRFPALLESTFGQGISQRLSNASMRAERLATALEAATPLLRLTRDQAGNLAGQTGVLLGHEANPPEALEAALSRLGFPVADCTELPRKLADHLVIWTERGGFAPDSVVAIDSLPGSWPPREPALGLMPPPRPLLEAPDIKLLERPPQVALLPAPAHDEPQELERSIPQAATAVDLDPGDGLLDDMLREAEARTTPERQVDLDPGDGLLDDMLREEEARTALERQADGLAPGSGKPKIVEDLDDGLLAQMLAEEGLT